MVKIFLYIVAICICLWRYYLNRRTGLLYLISVFLLQIFKEYLVAVYSWENAVGIALWILPTIIYAIVLFRKS